MIRAISFDLWFTLIWEKQPEDEELYNELRIGSIVETLRLRGYEVPTGIVRELFKNLGGTRMLLSSRELASIVLSGLGIRYDSEL
ncbi:MAG: hypothetical protein NZ925_00830, partial [Sulfolobales archaeon]|nr:hypothetical protein [Sulfolobales archaeon]